VDVTVLEVSVMNVSSTPSSVTTESFLPNATTTESPYQSPTHKIMGFSENNAILIPLSIRDFVVFAC